MGANFVTLINFEFVKTRLHSTRTLKIKSAEKLTPVTAQEVSRLVNGSELKELTFIL